MLRVPAGDVATWQDGDLSWVRARPAWIHPITRARLDSAAAVEALTGPPPGEGSYYAWAWIDEAAGSIRSRYFVADLGIGEDEATGAAAVMMGGLLGRRARDPPGGRVGAPRPAGGGRDGRGRRSGRGRSAPARSPTSDRQWYGMSDTVDPGVTTTTSPSPAGVPLRGGAPDHARQRRVLRRVRAPLAGHARARGHDRAAAGGVRADGPRLPRGPAARAPRSRCPTGEHRLVVVPRTDPETGETYGVTTHLRVVGDEDARP